MISAKKPSSITGASSWTLGSLQFMSRRCSNRRAFRCRSCRAGRTDLSFQMQMENSRSPRSLSHSRAPSGWTSDAKASTTTVASQVTRLMTSACLRSQFVLKEDRSIPIPCRSSMSPIVLTEEGMPPIRGDAAREGRPIEIIKGLLVGLVDTATSGTGMPSVVGTGDGLEALLR